MGVVYISSICYYLPAEENALDWTHEEKEESGVAASPVSSLCALTFFL